MIDVVLSPGEFGRVKQIGGGQVVVLDVLRATSTIVAALRGGARGVRLFDSLDGARSARRGWDVMRDGPVVLAGEKACVKPEDFDLGNSPREMEAHRVGGATVLLATTNGTRAASAMREKRVEKMFAGSLLNATATATALLPGLQEMETTLVCAGTNGLLALEDVIGAGAILFAILQATYRTDLAFSDSAWLAYHAFAAVRQRLPAALRLGAGGVNVIEAGLEEDIDFCARLDALPIVAAVEIATLRVTKGA